MLKEGTGRENTPMDKISFIFAVMLKDLLLLHNVVLLFIILKINTQHFHQK
jgi:hypothetical protein